MVGVIESRHLRTALDMSVVKAVLVLVGGVT